jgi:hypothetical protein
MVRIARALRTWFWIAALLLVLDLLVLIGQIKATVDAGVCFERSNSEMILCDTSPPAVQVLLAAVVAFCLAGLLVLEVARARAVVRGGDDG